MKKVLLRIVQTLITVGILVWVFRDPKMRANIPVILHQANPWWILLGVACAGVAEVANIFRWQIFLRVQKVHVPLARTAMVFMIGVFFNLFLLDSTGGDVVRAAYLCAEQESKKAGIILSVVVDRLLGMFILVPFGVVIVILRYRWFTQTPATAAMYWFLIVFMTVMTIFFVAAFTISRLDLTDKLPAWLTKRQSIMRVIKACSLFGKSWRESLIAYALSFPILFGTFAPFYCAARAFNANVSLVDMYSIMPIVVVASAVPISVSGFGVREGLFKSLLGTLASVPAELAVLISLAGFLSYISWSLIGAVIWLVSKPARGK
jgi:uncharacterized protein (TIRG00374 family)